MSSQIHRKTRGASFLAGANWLSRLESASWATMLIAAGGAAFAAGAPVRTPITPVLFTSGLSPAGQAVSQPGQGRLQELRREMVELQIRERGIVQPDLLRAFGDVPRHEFVPESLRDRAYADEPLPIRDSDTAPESISQPYLSARMIELLDLQPTDRVLEIGTGSGYDAALLSRLAKEVFTVEIDERLAERAKERLAKLQYDNVTVRVGDGYRGWLEEAPFDAILLTTAPREMPEHLVEQLEVGGKMVVPVGSFVQELLVITRTPSGEETRTIMPIRVNSMKGPNER